MDFQSEDYYKVESDLSNIMDRIKIDKKAYLSFWAAAEHNGKLYISDPNNRGLLEYDLTTGETVVKNIFMAENNMNNYRFAFEYKGQIWFVPLRNSGEIAIYNVNNNIEYIAIPKSESKCEYRPFAGSYVIGDKAYLVPAYYDCLLCIDLESRNMRRIDIEINKYAGDAYTIYKSSYLKDNKIYFCPYNNAEVKYFDTATGIVDNIPVVIGEKKYSNVCVWDNELYLLPKEIKNGILKYNIKEKTQEVICLDDNNVTMQCECSFMRDNIIYGLPYNSNKMYLFDCLNNRLELKDFCTSERTLSFLFAQALDENRVLILSEDKKTPCMIWEKERIQLVDIKLQEDYFIKELLMELEERG